ncbi:hypothetical protein EV379_0044 [Microterricola gilva]|uniref:Uncharacterized protein n=1 Tax=Microterricola gilva TaxID=393267 RepID=A0A4Q8AIX9_9MICO|nr:hypothetical protein [Microterricola gilva]RZU63755.1 hypothetical protein EV379_0044 [Microterricola gilva]
MKHGIKAVLGTTLATAGLIVTIGAVAGLAVAASSTPMVQAALSSAEPESEQGSETDAVADVDAVDAGDPTTSGAEPVVTPAEQAERTAWLEQQAIVRDCMEEQGFEYLYFEWWSPEFLEALRVFQSSDGQGDPLPPKPPGLSAEERAAWELAEGGVNDGEVYDWKDAGCWGYAVHVMGNDESN